MLKVKKRHTRILGTLNKKADKEFINSLVKNGMDGVRVFCDGGYENC
jgi:pyruvate kinase